jgi:Ca2+-binding RTX toxin-like protein
VTLGAGSETIHAGVNDIFTAVAGTAGSDTIFGFSGNDQLDFTGFSGNPVAGGSLYGGNAILTLTDGAVITLMNMTQLPKFG